MTATNDQPLVRFTARVRKELANNLPIADPYGELAGLIHGALVGNDDIVALPSSTLNHDVETPDNNRLVRFSDNNSDIETLDDNRVLQPLDSDTAELTSKYDDSFTLHVPTDYIAARLELLAAQLGIAKPVVRPLPKTNLQPEQRYQVQLQIPKSLAKQVFSETTNMGSYLAGLTMANGTFSPPTKPVHTQWFVPTKEIATTLQTALGIPISSEAGQAQKTIVSTGRSKKQQGKQTVSFSDNSDTKRRKQTQPFAIQPTINLTNCSCLVNLLQNLPIRVVLKSGERVSIVLKTMGALEAEQEFLDGRSSLLLRKSANRATNADRANVKRATEAAGKHITIIEELVTVIGWDAIPENLQEIALVRVVNPEISLRELGELIQPGLSKHAVHRRLKQLETMHKQLLKKDP